MHYTLYVYVYICLYICMYVYICVYMCIYVRPQCLRMNQIYFLIEDLKNY